MDFGKLPSVDHVDFRLPPPPTRADERSLKLLEKRRTPLTPPRIRLGCPVWNHRGWLGKVYELGSKPADFLKHYSRQFGMVELNATHYAIPSREAVAHWREQTPEDFRFCPKWPQEISHHRELKGCEALTEAFCVVLSELGPRLGTSFLQLAPHFGPERLPELARFLETVPATFPLCVEFRNPRWFEDHALIASAWDVLESSGAGAVITDVAGRREVAHFSLSASRVLIRFIGNDLHPTDFERTDAWMPRLAMWLNRGIQEVDLCVHQPGNDLEPELIRYWIERLLAQPLAGKIPLELKTWTPQDRGTQISFL